MRPTAKNEDVFSKMEIDVQKEGGIKEKRKNHNHKHDTGIKKIGEKKNREYFVASFYYNLDPKYYDENYDIKINTKIDGYNEMEAGGNHSGNKNVISSSVFPVVDGKSTIPAFNCPYGIIFDPYDCDFEEYGWHDLQAYEGKEKNKNFTYETEQKKSDMITKKRNKKTIRFVNNTDYDFLTKSYQPNSQSMEDKKKLIKFALEQNDRINIRGDMIKLGDINSNYLLSSNNKEVNKKDIYNELRLRGAKGQKTVKTKAIIVKTFKDESTGKDTLYNVDAKNCRFILDFCRTKKFPYVYLFNEESREIKKVGLEEFIDAVVENRKRLYKQNKSGYFENKYREEYEQLKELKLIAAKIDKDENLSLDEEKILNPIKYIRQHIENIIVWKLGKLKTLYWDREGKDRKLMNDRNRLLQGSKFIRIINEKYDQICKDRRQNYLQDMRELLDLVKNTQVDKGLSFNCSCDSVNEYRYTNNGNAMNISQLHYGNNIGGHY